MTSSAHPRERSWIAVVGAAIAVALVCALAAWHPWRTTATPPAGAGAAAAGVADRPAPPALSLPARPRVLVFGDSWVYGSAATVPTQGFAYLLPDLLGWDVVVDGVRGSGYLKPGIDGPAYGERIAALDPALAPDLIIVEGSINDRRLYPTGYADAVTSAWDVLSARFPDAAVVVLGPAPQVLPVEKATAAIDETLARLAADRDWWYISPLADGWITEANYDGVIDSSDTGRDHPSTAGHAYLADRLAEALRTITAGADAAADAAPDIEPAAP